MSDGRPEGLATASGFPMTQWSLVARAGQPPAEARAALDVLLRRYAPALRAHLLLDRRMSGDRSKAEDVLQGFVADKVLERNLIALADRERGRFRTFLLAALD